jgi:L-alanine-DL-glutamate epimerase-like enolase superfamily enzyme
MFLSTAHERMIPLNTDIKLCEIGLTFTDAVLRTPLKFGAGVVAAVTNLVCRVLVETPDGRQAEGYGNILLSDLWGFPSQVVGHAQRDQAMRAVADAFADYMFDNRRFGHPMDLYLEAKPALNDIAAQVSRERKLAEPMPILGALVCASPVDAALHDAFGKANGTCSYDGYGPEFMTHDLSQWCGAEFNGMYPGDYLHQTYKPRLPIFHLVGGVDKLTRGEVTADDPQDGLPVSLEEWTERDGIRCFKVKLRGNDNEWDVERTAQIAEVITATYEKLGIRDRFYLSTDSNEMNPNPESVVEYLRKLEERSPLAFEALLYLEQPTERDLSGHRFDMRPVAAIKPVVVDEGVTDVDKMDLAIELGWSGVGLKTCKGHSSSLLYVAKAKEKDLVLTFQDLTNPGLSLVHEAGFAARIDTLMGFEYNSRQYLPYEQPEVVRGHESLFTVVDGQVSTETLSDVGLGYRYIMPLEAADEGI